MQAPLDYIQLKKASKNINLVEKSVILFQNKIKSMTHIIQRVLMVLFLGVLVFHFPASSQKIPDIDKLTDDQLKSFIQKGEEGGYTEDQLFLGAKARGMSDVEMSKFRQRIKKLKVRGTEKKANGLNAISDSRMRQEEEEEDLFDPFSELMGERSDTLPKIFGMDYFSNYNISFEPNVNIPTPINYRLGPGDEIIIDLWGDSEQTYQEQISPDGYIRIEKLGPIYLNGLKIGVATEKIKAKLKILYGTLGSSTYAQISLGQIRSIKVNVIGEVMVPGTYSMSSLASAFNALYMAGGPQATGSLRKIEVYRNGQFHDRLDAYQFLIFGEGKDINLSDGDVVIVKTYDTRVYVSGEIKRPAFYDMAEGESLSQLLTYAGGVTDMGYTERISVRRKEGNFRAIKTFTRGDSTALLNGDEVEIQRISNRYTNRVQIEGAVNFPGAFEFTDGLMLSALIEQAGGLAGDAFLGRGVIIRLGADLNLTNQSVNLEEVISGTYDITLKNEDLIKIQSIHELREIYTVRIEGEIQAPGNYPYIDNMTVEDLIFLAKGFKESAARNQVEIARRGDINSSESSSQILTFPINKELISNDSASKTTLRPFDLLTIRRAAGFVNQQLVEIEGEVIFPGKYGIKSKKETIADLIVRAGGLNPEAYIEGSMLIRTSEYLKKEGELTNYRRKIKRAKVLTILEGDTDPSLSSQTKFDLPEAIGIDLKAILSNPKSEANMTLQDGDIISIPQKSSTVRIRGEVLNPGKVMYREKLHFGQYVGRSGGFSSMAKKSKSFIIYANGASKRTTKFLGLSFYPKVLPGSEIVVPKKPITTKMSIAEIVGLASALASLTLVINSLTN